MTSNQHFDHIPQDVGSLSAMLIAARVQSPPESLPLMVHLQPALPTQMLPETSGRWRQISCVSQEHHK